jgi:hypothetical protein
MVANGYCVKDLDASERIGSLRTSKKPRVYSFVIDVFYSCVVILYKSYCLEHRLHNRVVHKSARSQR